MERSSLEVGFVDHDGLDLALRLANFLGQVADGGADLLDLLVAELDGLHHGLFRNFLGAGLDHHDAVGGADHHQVQLAVALLVVGGIDDEIAVHLADAHRADGAVKRNVGNAERDRRAVDAGDVGIVGRIGREHHGDDLGLAAEAFGEQRPDGPVDLAAGENFALAGPPFALDEAAGNASGGVGVFAVVDGEGEEVDALTRVGVGAGGGENNVVADAHNAGAVGLLG